MCWSHKEKIHKELVKEEYLMITGDNFAYFFMKTYSEALLMSTHNVVLRFT